MFPAPRLRSLACFLVGFAAALSAGGRAPAPDDERADTTP